jgi:hypothetical protein
MDFTFLLSSGQVGLGLRTVQNYNHKEQAEAVMGSCYFVSTVTALSAPTGVPYICQGSAFCYLYLEDATCYCAGTDA